MDDTSAPDYSGNLDDYGMPYGWGDPKSYNNLEALTNLGVNFDDTSAYSGYDFGSLAGLGFRAGDSIQGVDANRFYKYSYPDESQDNKWYKTEYTNQNGKWTPGQTQYGQEVKGNFKDFVKTAAPIALSVIPGVGTGLSSMFGGGAIGNIGAGAVLGAGNAAIQGGDIGKGALYGGLGGGIGTGVNALNPAGALGIESKGLGTLFNRGITTGLNTAIQGGNVGKAVGTTLLTGGLNLAGKELGNLGQGNTNMGNDFNIGAEFGDTSGFSGTELGSLFGSYQPTSPQIPLDGPDPMSFYQPDLNGFGQYNSPQQSQPGATQGNPIAQFFASQFAGGGGRGVGGLGDLAGSLMGLYQANRQRRAMKDQANSLSAMFGQNSPYASTLRNQLNRRDAASGRRSQYGPREVELQAKLAQMASSNAPAWMQAQTGQDNARAMMLKNLLQLGNQSGGFRGLASLFNQGGGQGAQDPFNSYLYSTGGSGD